MFKEIAVLLPFLCLFSIINAQEVIKPIDLKLGADSLVVAKILTNLDTLYAQINTDSIKDPYIGKERSILTKEVLKSWKNTELNEADSIPNFYKKQLVNLFRIAPNQYMLQIAYLSKGSATTPPTLRMMIQLVANVEKEQVQFSVPLTYLTRRWSSQEIGNITYYFRDSIKSKRAGQFDERNTAIATKFGLTPEKMKFYMCENYQEILSLVGILYDSKEGGATEYGYGVVANSIFSIKYHEDFSHDIFHYYSGQINRFEDRNWVAEEGIAYSWGNAYYVNDGGVMITQQTLLSSLKVYFQAHPNQSLFELFEENENVLSDISTKISIRSTIASLLCDEIEKRHGLDGVLKIINCGRKPSSLAPFFTVLQELIGIDKQNFDEEVGELLEEYK